MAGSFSDDLSSYAVLLSYPSDFIFDDWFQFFNDNYSVLALQELLDLFFRKRVAESELQNFGVFDVFCRICV